MADLDFEELDKAVNTLMAGVDSTKRNTAFDDPEDVVVSLAIDDEVADKKQPEPVPQPAESVDAPTAEVEATTEPVLAAAPSQTSLATKRRGQFMDMVHPSSDMKSAVKPPVRRTTIVVTPPAEATPEEPITSVPEVDVPTLADYNSDSAEQPSLEDESDTTTPEPMAANPEPLSSPFLPDAKPEKRPLGGIAISDESTPASEQSELDKYDNDTEVAEPSVASEPNNFPDELSSDILAIEYSDVTGEGIDAEDAKDTEQDQPEEPVTKQAERIEPVETHVEEESLPVPQQTVVPAGGSIAQQYTEEPSTGDQTNGSIYDTANYHQAIAPVEEPEKKASPLKWIILSILLLVAGAGAGVGYFFLTR